VKVGHSFKGDFARIHAFVTKTLPLPVSDGLALDHFAAEWAVFPSMLSGLFSGRIRWRVSEVQVFVPSNKKGRPFCGQPFPSSRLVPVYSNVYFVVALVAMDCAFLIASFPA
jgi:hypothetical protein